MSSDPPIDVLRNLGPASRNMLEALGIHNRSDLARWGAVGVFLRAKQAGLRPSLNLLYALEGALTDRDWRDFSADEKQALRRRLETDDDGTLDGP